MAKFFAQGVYNEKESKKVAQKHAKLPEFNQENAQTYFDIQIGDPKAAPL